MTIPATDHTIVTVVREIAAAELGVPVASLSPQANLRELEGMDSVKVLRMIAKIEHAYDIELEDEVVFELTTITATAEAVRAALADTGLDDAT
jgi:acyl carrier protein